MDWNAMATVCVPMRQPPPVDAIDHHAAQCAEHQAQHPAEIPSRPSLNAEWVSSKTNHDTAIDWRMSPVCETSVPATRSRKSR